MVVLNRIAYLRSLAQFGAKFVFSVSVNPVTGVQKIKVVVDPSCTIPLDQQFCTLNMLEFLAQLCFSHKVADKGHKHSSGISEVIFFITAPPFTAGTSFPISSSQPETSCIAISDTAVAGTSGMHSGIGDNDGENQGDVCDHVQDTIGPDVGRNIEKNRYKQMVEQLYKATRDGTGIGPIFDPGVALLAKENQETYDKILTTLEPSVHSCIFAMIDEATATACDSTDLLDTREEMKRIAIDINTHECKGMIDFWIDSLVPKHPEKEKDNG